MKLIVKTLGQFTLLTPAGEAIRFNHPNVVMEDNFIDHRVAKKQLRVLASVGDEATQEEFLAYLAEAKKDAQTKTAAEIEAFAVEAFVAAYPDENVVAAAAKAAADEAAVAAEAAAKAPKDDKKKASA